MRTRYPESLGFLTLAAAVLLFPDHAIAQNQTGTAKAQSPNAIRPWNPPLTPDGLNDSKEGFPEYHNVYIEPGSYEIYKKTGEFPDGTIMFKELQLTLSGENPDGSRTEPSGRGYFPGSFNGADVTVKDSKRYADTGGGGYYNFHHYEPKAPTAAVKPREDCAYCHIANAKKDEVWTQFYRLLDR